MSKDYRTYHDHNCCHRCGEKQPCGCHKNKEAGSQSNSSDVVDEKLIPKTANDPVIEKQVTAESSKTEREQKMLPLSPDDPPNS